MKESTIIVVLVFAMLITQAQDYLISFAGAGATTEVSTVKVDNLTSGATLTLNGEDILHLIPASGIGTPDIDNGTINIYPNPMAGQSILTFVVPENGHAVICIVDLSGRTIYQISLLLSPGAHSFRVSGISQGMYFVKVTGKNYDYSTKLISHSNLQSEVKIEYVTPIKNTTGNQLKSTTATIDMPYTNGDQLLFKGISGIYSTIVTDVPVSSKTITFNFVACTDNDNNNYTVVQVDTQTWMAENLKVTHYRNGEEIPNVTSGGDWYDLTTGALCWYNNDEASYKILYGALYNWYALTDSRNLCPTDWHSPTDAEWTTLSTYLGGQYAAGGKMKETGTTHWNAPNFGATNSSGFTALPGGFRSSTGGFTSLGNSIIFWSSTEYGSGNAWSYHLGYDNGFAIRLYDNDQSGYSVRCVKD
jgi:uncharacterized protein (TIGR02145 family)